MSEQAETLTFNGWQQPMQGLLCPVCDRRFVLPAGRSLTACPNCAASGLVGLAEEAEPWPPPEQLLPFQVSGAAVGQAVQQFASGLWFPPKDLTVANLAARCCYVYVPVWLVDVQVRANWRAEMGYNYQVVSHQDRYEDSSGGWRSREITETRQRWEPRVGQLERVYNNLPAPALEQHAAILRRLGPFRFEQAQPYLPAQAFSERVQQAVYLPDRSQADAWPEAALGLQSAGGEECRLASGADHLRNFRWSPVYDHANWSLLLLPVLTTYYVDDEQKRQMVLLHGQTGRLSGVRRASIQRATQVALYLGAAAAFLLLLTLASGAIGIFFPPLLVLATLFGLLALAFGAGALAPFLIVWWVNRTDGESQAKT